LVTIEQDANIFRRQAEPAFETRRELDHSLFKGISIQIDPENGEEAAAQLAALPAVKNMWPVEWIKGPTMKDKAKRGPQELATKSKRQSNGTADAPYTHVMTQVEKLHKQGFTGKGIKIAVVDTGVSTAAIFCQRRLY
jgi:hypothetical protein